MRPIDDMALFAAVVEHGSFTAAATALAMPLSTLSRRLAELEARLDTRLLERTTRRQKLTEAGQIYLRHCQQVVHEAREAERSLQRLQQEPTGHIRYKTPFAIDDRWGSTVISSFLEKYPKISIEGSVHLEGIDPDDDGVDFQLDYGDKPVTRHPVVSLGHTDLHLYASPGYLRRMGTPTSANALLEHALINLTLLPWPDYAPPAFRHLDPNYRITTNEMIMARQVCLDGVCMAWLPAVLTLKALEGNELVRVMPEHTAPMPLWMIVRQASLQTPKVRVMVEHIRDMVSHSAPWHAP
jgi:DNA-binding transcriptional LysR family regulator